jgi:hypothetical protein
MAIKGILLIISLLCFCLWADKIYDGLLYKYVLQSNVYIIRILHQLPVQTGISSPRVTVYDDYEALQSFR